VGRTVGAFLTPSKVRRQPWRDIGSTYPSSGRPYLPTHARPARPTHAAPGRHRPLHRHAL